MYINSNYVLEKSAQINTLYGVQHFCNMNRFWTTQHTDVSVQLKAEIVALKEEVVFIKWIGDNQEEPSVVHDTRRKIVLQSMKWFYRHWIAKGLLFNALKRLF